MNHCTGGEGAFHIDYLTYLEGWVERGDAPEKLTSFHVSIDNAKDTRELIERRMEFPLDPSTIEFSRPVYPYPTLTKYRGHGDPKNAASFEPVNP
jgi:feruloyl esterase